MTLENKEGEEIKRKFKELVKPLDIGLKIKMMNLSRNGVIIEEESNAGVHTLLSNDVLKKASMTVCWEAYQEEAGNNGLRRELVADRQRSKRGNL